MMPTQGWKSLALALISPVSARSQDKRSAGRTMEGKKMASERRRLRRLARVIGFFSGAVLLGAFMCTGTASAQCGPTGPISVKNTACGTAALASVTTGKSDSAFGHYTLNLNTKGSYNTATGADALRNNNAGIDNTANGAYALEFNTRGIDNTASGFGALQLNTTGGSNTASGVDALYNNATGAANTASGVDALWLNTTGGGNTASGFFSLRFNSTGNNNTASGSGALYSNNTGNDNTASGDNALYSNNAGNDNTASGFQALGSNTTGGNNIGLGYFAGSNIVTGSNNIDIGGAGTTYESNTIRIGTDGTQSATYIAGISTAQVTGNVVEVNSNGQLGIAMSSAHYKRDIRDMGGASAGLMKLRPVTFRYKNDPSGTLQYGLVAEEVARVYPELVTRDSEGKLQSVRYLEFTALLLNELQKRANQLQTQARETQELAQRLETEDRQLAAQQREIDALKRKDATIDALSARLAVLEQQARTAEPEGFGSLARK
jgi:hypothetical protein